MSAHPESSNGASAAGATPRTAKEGLWISLGFLWARRRLVVVVTGVSLVVAVIVALLLPRYYAGEARLLQPESDGLMGLLGGMVGQATPFRSFLGGPTSEYSRFLSILHSRSVRERLVQEFDLVTVYGYGERRYPMEATLRRLDRNLEFEIDPEFGHLVVSAYDRDPERAAAMTNHLVELLNHEHGRLSSDGARRTRVYIEERLNVALASLDSTRAAMQDFQERHGVIELESQARAYVTGMAELSARTAQLDVAYQTLVGQYGPDHPRVQAAASALRTARSQAATILAGGERLMPLALREVPALTRAYAELMQEQLIQTEVIETIYPLLEQARFQEQREAVAVQVLDAAIPPVRPERPSRRLIVVLTVLSTAVLVSIFAVAEGWLRRERFAMAASIRRVAQSV